MLILLPLKTTTPWYLDYLVVAVLLLTTSRTILLVVVVLRTGCLGRPSKASPIHSDSHHQDLALPVPSLTVSCNLQVALLCPLCLCLSLSLSPCVSALPHILNPQTLNFLQSYISTFIHPAAFSLSLPLLRLSHQPTSPILSSFSLFPSYYFLGTSCLSFNQATTAIAN